MLMLRYVRAHTPHPKLSKAECVNMNEGSSWNRKGEATPGEVPPAESFPLKGLSEKAHSVEANQINVGS